MKATLKTLLLASLASITVTASAQMSPQEQANREALTGVLIQRQIESNNAAGRAEANRRAQQEWQAREDAIQAKIAKWRATPYYGSLITQGNTNGLHWGGGQYNKRNIGKKGDERM